MLYTHAKEVVVKILKALLFLPIVCLSLLTFAGCGGLKAFLVNYTDIEGRQQTLKSLYKYEVRYIEMLKDDLDGYSYNDKVLESVTESLEHKVYWTNDNSIIEMFEGGRLFTQIASYSSLGFEMEGVKTMSSGSYGYSEKYDCYVYFKIYVGRNLGVYNIDVSYTGEHCNISYPQQISSFQLGELAVEYNQISIPQVNVNIQWQN